MVFANVRETSLAEAWQNSAAFNRFRGTDWMAEPCRSCARREIDWGGCRCQAAALLGDAAATDPACALSPSHGVLADALARAEATPETFTFREMRAGRLLEPNPS
jgi:pyrroloquinoline quinone biosynthesis protein E